MLNKKIEDKIEHHLKKLRNINNVVFMAIVKDHSKAMAEGIESAEFTLH